MTAPDIATRKTCGPMDVCYCTPRCKGAGSGLPKATHPTPAKLMEYLREEGTSTHHVAQGVGFLAHDEYTYTHRGSINPQGPDAAWLIERLLLFVAHDTGCSANELDPLDDTPCRCGLRDLLQGKAERYFPKDTAS